MFTSTYSGLRVLDLSHYLPGPYATLLLADLGAEVTKIEPPGDGDRMRLADPGAFAALNRKKRSLSLNLKSKAGQDIFRRLAAAADVVVEGFKPGAAAKLGVDYASLAPANPRLIYCSISGYGQTGPKRDLPGHDPNYLAFTGALSMVTQRDGTPVLPYLMVADMAGSLFAFMAIQTALFERERTGQGRYIDLSMTDATLALMVPAAGYFYATGRPQRATNRMHPLRWPYRTRDGGFIVLGVREDPYWPRLCAVIGRPDLAAEPELRTDRGRETQSERLWSILGEIFSQKDLAQWLDLLTAANLPASPVYTIAEALAEEHFHVRGTVRNTPFPDGSIKPLLGHPLSRAPEGPPAPGVGEHSAAIVAELGLGEATIAEFRARGVI